MKTTTDSRFFVSVLKTRNVMGDGFHDSVWIFKASSKEDILNKGFTPNIIEIFSKKDDAVALANQFADKHEYFAIN